MRLEILPGASFATENLAGADLGTGGGAEVNVSYRFLPHLAGFAGWDWHRFAATTSFAGSDVDFEETGYAFGVRFEHPIGSAAAPALMVRVGGTYNHIEIENAAGDILTDSGHGFGWEAGTGLAFRLGDRWHLTPSVRFRSLKKDLSLGNFQTEGTLRYVAAEVGFSRNF